VNVNDLVFYCVDCGQLFDHTEIEKKKLENPINYVAVLECGACSGTQFEIYTKKCY